MFTSWSWLGFSFYSSCQRQRHRSSRKTTNRLETVLIFFLPSIWDHNLPFFPDTLTRGSVHLDLGRVGTYRGTAERLIIAVRFSQSVSFFFFNTTFQMWQWLPRTHLPSWKKVSDDFSCAPAVFGKTRPTGTCLIHNHYFREWVPSVARKEECVVDKSVTHVSTSCSRGAGPLPGGSTELRWRAGSAPAVPEVVTALRARDRQRQPPGVSSGIHKVTSRPGARLPCYAPPPKKNTHLEKRTRACLLMFPISIW